MARKMIEGDAMNIRWNAVGALLFAAAVGCSNGGGGGGPGGGGPGGGGPGGQSIPCGAAGTCTDGNYCTWHYDTCGDWVDDFQQCSETPPECGPDSRPICACDGQVYDTFCEAVKHGPVGQGGGCTTPEGWFPCGNSFCKPGEEYCRQQEIGDYIDSECIKPPAGCTSCDCIAPPGGADACTCSVKNGQFYVECPPEF
jgi:hypothetical protein